VALPSCCGDEAAQVAVGDAVRQQPEHQQRGEQGVGAGVGEPEPGDPVALGGDDRGR
jgi:hypothetical protein